MSQEWLRGSVVGAERDSDRRPRFAPSGWDVLGLVGLVLLVAAPWVAMFLGARALGLI